MRKCAYACLRVSARAPMLARVCVFVCVCVCVRACSLASICVSVCVHARVCAGGRLFNCLVNMTKSGRGEGPLMQEVARSDREDPEEALQKAGIACGFNGIHYLTWSQLGVICDSFEEMEASLDFESTAWYVMDCLNRARTANARMPSRRSRW
jgi:hypothetical protein